MHTRKGIAARRGMNGTLAATAVAGAVLVILAGSAAASAAEPAITGETTVRLDFTDPTGVDVSVITRNTSLVAAFGSARVVAPDGTPYLFGPKSYEPGEVWTYDVFLPGFTCADLGRVTATAAGTDLPDDAAADWTSGAVRAPDPRVTVVGCDPAPPPPPAEPETPVDPGTPAVVAAPVAAPIAAPVAKANELPASQTDGALVASSWPMLGIAGAVGILAVLLSGGLAQWARRH